MCQSFHSRESAASCGGCSVHGPAASHLQAPSLPAPTRFLDDPPAPACELQSLSRMRRRRGVGSADDALEHAQDANAKRRYYAARSNRVTSSCDPHKSPDAVAAVLHFEDVRLVPTKLADGKATGGALRQLKLLLGRRPPSRAVEGLALPFANEVQGSPRTNASSEEQLVSANILSKEAAALLKRDRSSSTSSVGRASQPAPVKGEAESSKRNGLPGYRLGDPPKRPHHMLQPTSPSVAMEDACSLKPHDFAFVKRSNGGWTYAIVADRQGGTTEGEKGASIRFVLDGRGNTKVVKRKFWRKGIRRVNHDATEAEANDEMEKGESDRNGIGKMISKKMRRNGRRRAHLRVSMETTDAVAGCDDGGRSSDDGSEEDSSDHGASGGNANKPREGGRGCCHRLSINTDGAVVDDDAESDGARGEVLDLSLRQLTVSEPRDADEGGRSGSRRNVDDSERSARTEGDLSLDFLCLLDDGRKSPAPNRFENQSSRCRPKRRPQCKAGKRPSVASTDDTIRMTKAASGATEGRTVAVATKGHDGKASNEGGATATPTGGRGIAAKIEKGVASKEKRGSGSSASSLGLGASDVSIFSALFREMYADKEYAALSERMGEGSTRLLLDE